MSPANTLHLTADSALCYSGKTSLLLQYAISEAMLGSAVMYICKRSSLEDAAEGAQCWQLPENLLQNIGIRCRLVSRLSLYQDGGVVWHACPCCKAQS